MTILLGILPPGNSSRQRSAARSVPAPGRYRAAAGEELFGSLRHRLEAHMRFGKPPPVVPAWLGEEAGRYGAAIGAWRMISSILQSLQVPLEEGVASWPPDGRAPGS